MKLICFCRREYQESRKKYQKVIFGDQVIGTLFINGKQKDEVKI